MTEENIVELVSTDDGMMDVLGVAATLALPNWLIGALSFVRRRPSWKAKRDKFRTRFREKRWQEMWPRLRSDLV